ncbi:hypothetical protein [Microbacterium halotolerans]|uniref:hypothetical protein n=1 Tax=Microbacterium halotolerans TaxID=246613 RepID=UPI0013C31B46|nr:hypothetical protein [Microbacterium halotolerans]
MASEWMGEPIAQIEGPDDAAHQLAERDRLREQTEPLNPPREFAVLRMWTELAHVTYIGTVLLLLASYGVTSDETTHMVHPHIFALLAPLIASSNLLDGARERFRVRTRKILATTWVALIIGASVFVVATIGIFTDVTVPWWIAVATTIAMVALILPMSLRQVARSVPVEAKEQPAAPLDSASRVTMLCIAASIGLMLTPIGFPTDSRASAVLYAFAVACFLAASIATLVNSRTRFSPSRLGYAWGRWQWTALGVCGAVCVTVVLFDAYTSLVDPLLGISAGALTTALLGVAAFLPATARAAEE